MVESIINESDLELKLLAGLPIEITNMGYIYPLKVGEIIAIGESEYNILLSYLLIDKSNIPELKDEDISNLEIIMIQSHHNEAVRDMILKGLSLFTHKDYFLDESGLFYFIDENEQIVFLDNKEAFDIFQYILKKANNIKMQKEPEYNPGNERAKKFIEKMMKNKQKQPKKKENIDLHSIISGVAWKSHSVSILNIFDLTIYQLYDAFYRLNSIDNYHYTLSGVYAGTVDGKKINYTNIDWAKIMKN